MKRLVLGSAALATSLLIAAAAPQHVDSAPRRLSAPERDRSIAAFREVATVLQSPRCMNCHVAGDRPRQGDDRHIHAQNVMRGPDGKGLPGLGCANCHQDRNNETAGGPPGVPHWQMPSAAMPMSWENLSVGDLCRLITDRNRNGHRNITDLIPHMRTPLVLWAWNPGPDRTTPPLSQEAFMAKLHEWIETGGVCEN